MKIAASTSDGETIDHHFGNALGFVVLTIEEGKVVNTELRDLAEDPPPPVTEEPAHHSHDHHHENGENHQCRSGKLLNLIPDCSVVLSRGMCEEVYGKLQEAKLGPLLTDVVSIDEAVQAYAEGRLENHPELIRE
jgi:predicted Fe-Mo cluster-binding NifX family protein